MRLLLLTGVLIISSTTGCNGLRGRQSIVAQKDPNELILAVKSERDIVDREPVVVLSHELENSRAEGPAAESPSSIWSKLASPARFLLPRTDSAEQSQKLLDSGQGLDDGF